MVVEEPRDVGRLLGDRAVLDAALKQGAREALRVHREAGLPLAVWRDGRTEWVTPEEFERRLDARAPN
jgi:hypothetical protein